MSEMNVVTCTRCRAAYNMDMEPALDDVHFNPRTGEECEPGDSGWDIALVPYRVDWRIFH